MAANLFQNFLKLAGVQFDRDHPISSKIRDAIENTKNFIGIGGIFNFSPEDHNGLTKEAFVLIKIVNGEWTLLE